MLSSGLGGALRVVRTLRESGCHAAVRVTNVVVGTSFVPHARAAGPSLSDSNHAERPPKQSR
jgi:hypothetical protein